MTQPGSQVALAEAGRQIQLRLRAAMLTEVLRAWPLLNVNRLDETWPDWLQVMTTILTRYNQQSSTAAGAYYRAARTAQLGQPPSPGLVKTAATPAAVWLTKALGWSGPGQMTRTNLPREQAVKTALTQTLGTAGRVMLAGQRSTILHTVKADPEAVGWYRKTDGDPCYFCALLASRPVIGGRGALYRNERNAGFAAHNHCACVAAPMFTTDQDLPAVNVHAADVYQSRGKGPALKAFRKAWDERERPAA